MEQSFMPDFGKTSVVKGRPWLYTPILPLVFGAELSYMEQVAKLHMKVNELIQNDTIAGENFAKLVEAFKQWEEYLNGLAVADGAITTAKLADGAVTASKIAQQAVESQHIAKGAVGSQELGEHAVEGHNLAVGAVDRFSKIANGVIVSEHFAPGAVDTSAIAEGSVTDEKVANNTLGINKMALDVQSQWNSLVSLMNRLTNGTSDLQVRSMLVSNALTLTAMCVVNCNEAVLHNLGEPVSDSDAVTKRYVDNIVARLREEFESGGETVFSSTANGTLPTVYKGTANSENALNFEGTANGAITE